MLKVLEPMCMKPELGTLKSVCGEGCRPLPREGLGRAEADALQ